MPRLRVALTTIVWKRYQVTRAFWLWAQYLREWWRDDVEVLFCAVGANDPIHEEIASEAGVYFSNAPNSPLGGKFNCALSLAKELKPDYVLITGSDDFFDADVAVSYKRLLLENHTFTGFRDHFFYDIATDRVGYWPGYNSERRREEPCGAGRFVRADIMDALDWKLWDEDIDKGMDHSSFRRLRSVNAACRMIYTSVIGTAVDVKCADNLWSFDHVKPWRIHPEDGKRIMDRLPSDVLSLIKSQL